MTTRKTLILMITLFSAAAFAQQSGGNRQMRQQMPQMAQIFADKNLEKICVPRRGSA